MVSTESQPTGGDVRTREAPTRPDASVAPHRQPRTRVAMVGVLLAVLLVGAGVAVALLVAGGDAPDAVGQVEGGIPGADMTDAERSLRLHLEAAREARLATASRMTEAERSLRLHQEAAREVSGR